MNAMKSPAEMAMPAVALSLSGTPLRAAISERGNGVPESLLVVGDYAMRAASMAAAMEAAEASGRGALRFVEAGHDGEAAGTAMPDPWAEGNGPGEAASAAILAAATGARMLPGLLDPDLETFCAAVAATHAALSASGGIGPGAEGVRAAAGEDAMRRAVGSGYPAVAEYVARLDPGGFRAHSARLSVLEDALGLSGGGIGGTAERRASFSGLSSALAGSGSWSGPDRYLALASALRETDAAGTDADFVVDLLRPGRGSPPDAGARAAVFLSGRTRGRAVAGMEPRDALECARRRLPPARTEPRADGILLSMVFGMFPAALMPREVARALAAENRRTRAKATASAPFAARAAETIRAAWATACLQAACARSAVVMGRAPAGFLSGAAAPAEWPRFIPCRAP